MMKSIWKLAVGTYGLKTHGGPGLHGDGHAVGERHAAGERGMCPTLTSFGVHSW
jgi:hypothetical protein